MFPEPLFAPGGSRAGPFAFQRADLDAIKAALGAKWLGGRIALGEATLELKGTECVLNTPQAQIKLGGATGFRTDRAGRRLMLLFGASAGRVTTLSLSRTGFSVSEGVDMRAATAQWEAGLPLEAAGALVMALETVQGRPTRPAQEVGAGWTRDDAEWAEASGADGEEIERIEMQLARGAEDAFDELWRKLKLLRVPRIGKSISGCLPAGRRLRPVEPTWRPRHPLLARAFKRGPDGAVVLEYAGCPAAAREEDSAHVEVWQAEGCTGEPWIGRLGRVLTDASHPLGRVCGEFEESLAAGLVGGGKLVEWLHRMKSFAAELLELSVERYRLRHLVAGELRRLRGCFERRLLHRLYPALIALLGLAHQRPNSKFVAALAHCTGWDAAQFGAAADLSLDEARLEAAIAKLQQLSSAVSPMDKVSLVIDCCSCIIEACVGHEVGADDLVPVLALCTVRAGVPDMPAQLSYVEQLISSNEDGEV